MIDGAGAFLRQSGCVVAWTAALSRAEWESPSALPRWSVRDLVAHVVVVHESLLRTLGQDSDAAALALGDYVATYSAHAEQLEAIAQERSSALPAERLGARLTEMRDALVAPLAEARPVVLASARGAVNRVDFVRTRVLELIVHSDDLARSLPDRAGPHLDREALDITVGVLLEARAHQHPGDAQRITVAGVGEWSCDGVPGRFEVDPLDVVRIFTGRAAPTAWNQARTDPSWGPVLA